jgi:hypothetical protein
VEPQEAHEHIQEAHEHIGEGGQERNKRIAVLVAALAAMLAITETGGKNAQTEAVTANIAASDTWAFYQAKTVRMTVVKSIADAVEALGDGAEPAHAASLARATETFRDEAQRLDTDEKTHEGRRELAERARRYMEERDRHMARYRNFEYGSAALQLAIVLASASVITGVVLLAWAAGGLGLLGTGLCLLGWFAPNFLDMLP